MSTDGKQHLGEMMRLSRVMAVFLVLACVLGGMAPQLSAGPRDATRVKDGRPAVRPQRTPSVRRDARNNVTYVALRQAPSAATPGPASGTGPRGGLSTDPQMEPGWPVTAVHLPGTYHAGPAIHTLVGNIDADPELEIVTTSLAVGPLNAWNHDGSPVYPWLGDIFGAAYPVMARFEGNDLGSRVGVPVRTLVVGFFSLSPNRLIAYNMLAYAMPGWPVMGSNFVASPPSAGPIDGGPFDMIVTEEEDWELHAYRRNGLIPPGWPVWGDGGQEKHTPAIADLDGDGDLEIVTASGWTTPGVYVLALHHTGAPVTGFPVIVSGFVDTFVTVGDVDGDAAPEIVLVGRTGAYPAPPAILIFGAGGALERSIVLSGNVTYGAAPALADLSGDGTPEIIVQTDTTVEAYYGTGAAYPGWPVNTGAWGGWAGNSAPVVGDIDGDAAMEIVLTVQVAGSSENGALIAYDAGGVLQPGFPRTLRSGAGAVPAIADIDRDGRNEIVACGDFWNSFSGFYEKCWAYDLGGGTHGSIQWGQFMRDASHSGWYRAP